MLRLPLDKLSNTLHLINIKSNNHQGGTLIQMNGKQMCAVHFDTPLYVLVLQTSCITYDIYLIDLFTLEILLHHSGDELNYRDSTIDNPNELIYTVFIDHEISSNSFSFTFHLIHKLIIGYKEPYGPIYKSIPIEDSFAIEYLNQQSPMSKHIDLCSV